MKLQEILGLPPMRMTIGLMALAIIYTTGDNISLRNSLSNCNESRIKEQNAGNKALNDYLKERLDRYEKKDQVVDSVIFKNQETIQELTQKANDNVNPTKKPKNVNTRK